MARRDLLACGCAVEIAPRHEEGQAQVRLGYVDRCVHSPGLANIALRSKEHVQLKVVDRGVEHRAGHAQHPSTH
jgi:hypothetical protein